MSARVARCRFATLSALGLPLRVALALCVTLPAAGHADAIASLKQLFKDVFNAELAEGVELPILIPPPPSPITFGAPLKARIVNGNTVEVSGPLGIEGTQVCTATLQVSASGISLACELDLGFFKGSIGGQTDFRFKDYRLWGDGVTQIPGIDLPLGRTGLELSPQGLSASLSVYGVPLSLGPVKLSELPAELKKAVLSLLDPFELAKNVAKAAVAAAEYALGTAVAVGEKALGLVEDFGKALAKAVQWLGDAIAALEAFYCDNAPSLLSGLSDAVGLTDCDGLRQQKEADRAAAEQAKRDAEENVRKQQAVADQAARAQESAQVQRVLARCQSDAIEYVRQFGLLSFRQTYRDHPDESASVRWDCLPGVLRAKADDAFKAFALDVCAGIPGAAGELRCTSKPDFQACIERSKKPGSPIQHCNLDGDPAASLLSRGRCQRFLGRAGDYLCGSPGAYQECLGYGATCRLAGDPGSVLRSNGDCTNPGSDRTAFVCRDRKSFERCVSLSKARRTTPPRIGGPKVPATPPAISSCQLQFYVESQLYTGGACALPADGSIDRFVCSDQLAFLRCLGLAQTRGRIGLCELAGEPASRLRMRGACALVPRGSAPMEVPLLPLHLGRSPKGKVYDCNGWESHAACVLMSKDPGNGVVACTSSKFKPKDVLLTAGACTRGSDSNTYVCPTRLAHDRCLALSRKGGDFAVLRCELPADPAAVLLSADRCKVQGGGKGPRFFECKGKLEFEDCIVASKDARAGVISCHTAYYPAGHLLSGGGCAFYQSPWSGQFLCDDEKAYRRCVMTSLWPKSPVQSCALRGMPQSPLLTGGKCRAFGKDLSALVCKKQDDFVACLKHTVGPDRSVKRCAWQAHPASDLLSGNACLGSVTKAPLELDCPQPEARARCEALRTRTASQKLITRCVAPTPAPVPRKELNGTCTPAAPRPKNCTGDAATCGVVFQCTTKDALDTCEWWRKTGADFSDGRMSYINVPIKACTMK